MGSGEWVTVFYILDSPTSHSLLPTPHSLFPTSPSPAHQIHQRAQADAGRADGQIRFGAFVPCRASDVEMGPGSVLDEFANEICGGDCAGFAAADVFDIGDLALYLFTVIFIQR